LKLKASGRKMMEIAEDIKAKGVNENVKAGKIEGKIAKDTRLALEIKTGKSVVTEENYFPTVKYNEKLKYVADIKLIL